MSMQGNLSVERMCQQAGVSRAGFYRSLQQREPVEEDMAVRSAIQLIFAEHKRPMDTGASAKNCAAAACW